MCLPVVVFCVDGCAAFGSVVFQLRIPRIARRNPAAGVSILCAGSFSESFVVRAGGFKWRRDVCCGLGSGRRTRAFTRWLRTDFDRVRGCRSSVTAHEPVERDAKRISKSNDGADLDALLVRGFKHCRVALRESGASIEFSGRKLKFATSGAYAPHKTSFRYSTLLRHGAP